MFRAIPVSNRILSKKWEEKNQAIHQKKLDDMKPTIDSKRPASFTHLKRRAKKEQMLEDRYTEIERENRILLEKMSQIMQNKNIKGRITKPIQKKSLNNESRKRQLIQITMENQALLKRLQDKQSSYNVVRWEEDRKLTVKRLRNICEYPYRLGVTQEGRRNPSIDMRLTGRIATAASGRQTNSIKKAIPRKLEPLIRDGNRPIMFKRGMNLGDKYFLVEISLGHRVVFIDAHDVENPETFTLQMPIEEAVEIMGGEDKYEVLASSLALEDGGIVLMDHRTPIVYENKEDFQDTSTKKYEGEPIIHSHAYHQSEPPRLENLESETEHMQDQQYLNRSYDDIQQDGPGNVINFDSENEEIQDGSVLINSHIQNDQLKVNEYVEMMRRKSQSVDAVDQLRNEHSDYEESARSKPSAKSQQDLEDQLEQQEKQEFESLYRDNESGGEEENSKHDSIEEMERESTLRGITQEIDNISEESLQDQSRTSSRNMKSQSSASKIEYEDLDKSKVKPTDLSIRSEKSDSRLGIDLNLSQASSVRSKVSVTPGAEQPMSKASSVRSKVSVTPVGKDQSISKLSSIKSKHSIKSEHFEEYKDETINQTLSVASVRSQNLDRLDAEEEKSTSRQSLTLTKLSETPQIPSRDASAKSLAKEEIHLNTSNDKFSSFLNNRSQDLENSHISEFPKSVSSKHSSHIDLQKDQDLDISNVSNLQTTQKDSLLEQLNASKHSSVTNIRIDSRRNSHTSQASKKLSHINLSRKEASREILDENEVSEVKASLNKPESRASSSEREVSDVESRFTRRMEDETHNQSVVSVKENTDFKLSDSEKDQIAELSLEKVSGSNSKLNISKTSSKAGALVDSESDSKLNISKSSSKADALFDAESDSKLNISKSSSKAGALVDAESDSKLNISKTSSKAGALVDAESDSKLNISKSSSKAEALVDVESDSKLNISKSSSKADALVDVESDSKLNISKISSKAGALVDAESDSKLNISKISSKTDALVDSESDSKLNISKSSSSKAEALVDSESDSKLNISKSSLKADALVELESVHPDFLKSETQNEKPVKQTIERLKTITPEEEKATENSEVYTTLTTEATPAKKVKRKTGLNVVAEINEDANESLFDTDKPNEYQNLSGIKVSNIHKLDEAIENPASEEESSINTSFKTESTEKSYEFPKVPIRTRIQQFDTIMSNKTTSLKMTESEYDESVKLDQE